MLITLISALQVLLQLAEEQRQHMQGGRQQHIHTQAQQDPLTHPSLTLIQPVTLLNTQERAVDFSWLISLGAITNAFHISFFFHFHYSLLFMAQASTSGIFMLELDLDETCTINFWSVVAMHDKLSNLKTLILNQILLIILMFSVPTLG